MTGIILPLFFIVIAIVTLYFIYYTKKYLKPSRELKRIEALKRSPALALFTEISTGNVIIRNYD